MLNLDFLSFEFWMTVLFGFSVHLTFRCSIVVPFDNDACRHHSEFLHVCVGARALTCFDIRFSLEVHPDLF